MQVFQDQIVASGHCAVRLGPEERHNALRTTRNVIVENLALINCELIGEGLCTYGAPEHRSTARNVRLEKCQMNSFFGTGAIFDEVLVDGLRTSRSPVILSGCAFRHVTLRGELGRFLFNANVDHGDDARSQTFRDANTRFYEAVDWALDISEANASCIELRGAIPTNLVRRNPNQHFIMTREQAESGAWQEYEPYDSFSIDVSTFLLSGADRNIFVAAPRSRNFKSELAFYNRLRSVGIVS